jgi:arginyl-tRNA synthetase
VLHAFLEKRIQEAVSALLPDADPSAVLVRPCPDPRFGDYQTNALIALAKQRKLNPRQLAADVLARLDVREWCDQVEIAGAGFLNFRLKPEAIARVLASAARGEHLFFQKTGRPRTVVIDFSSPNVAKPMHVGHIRSTALGACLTQTLRLLGHRVITDNHLGDWGTQFGMLIIGWKTEMNPAALEADPLAELERLYKVISARCDEEKPEFNPELREQARAELVKLQAGDAENMRIWREILRLSQAQFDSIYARLGVKFDHTLGESFYNPQLKATVEELRARGVARESDGAWCVFSDESLPAREDPFLSQKDGQFVPNPFVVLKRDGGFNYATTDLATLAYRIATWDPREIIYVTDGRQQLHFRQLFATFRRWRPDLAAKVHLAHVWFGSILGDDGKPFKTRAGDTVKLADLLNEAEERALRVVNEKNPELSEEARRQVARIVGLGAVKYADLLPNRQSDYVFNWEKMLALSGNTAPYLQYAYARVRSVLRKAGAGAGAQPVPASAELQLTAPAELELARHLLNFGLVLNAVAEEYRPNFLCNYLYELAGIFSSFWETCPVLKAEGIERESRLALCDLTGRVLKEGMNVLGIGVLEQM